jgi:hypothetical protein
VFPYCTSIADLLGLKTSDLFLLLSVCFIYWYLYPCRELGIGIVAYSPLGRGFFGSGPKIVSELSDQDFRKVKFLKLNLVQCFDICFFCTEVVDKRSSMVLLCSAFSPSKKQIMEKLSKHVPSDFFTQPMPNCMLLKLNFMRPVSSSI